MNQEIPARHEIHPAVLAKLQPVAIEHATAIGEMLASRDDVYVGYWIRWARRLFVKVVATAPLSNRRLLIIQLDMIDAALEVIENARAAQIANR
jgi:hypothetical protein